MWGVIIAPAAATPSSGISFSPAYMVIDIPANQDAADASVAIKNDTNSTVQLNAQATDVDTTTSSLIPLTSASSKASKSLSIQNPDISLLPGKSVNLLVHINSTGLVAGGQYTSISIKRQTDTSVKSVPINQAVSIGVFITKEVGAARDLKLQTALPSGVRLSPPQRLVLSFRVDGNVQLVPRAAISVLGGGHVLAKSTINDASTGILPGNKHTFDVQLHYQHALSPGRHKLVVSYRYDGQITPVTVQSTFWYLPTWYVLLVLMGIAALTRFMWYYLRRKSHPAEPVEHPAPGTIVEHIVEAQSKPKPVRKTTNRQPKKAVKKVTTRKSPKPKTYAKTKQKKVTKK